VEATALTWIVALGGLALIGLLGGAKLIALINPRGSWTINNVYGGDPSTTDSRAYFAFNQGYAWADVAFWAPIQIGGSVGMLLGERWGFLLALVASVPFWYTAIPIFIWDRDMRFRQNTLTYWVFVWGIFPAYGVLETVYCFIRLLA